MPNPIIINSLPRKGSEIERIVSQQLEAEYARFRAELTRQFNITRHPSSALSDDLAQSFRIEEIESQLTDWIRDNDFDHPLTPEMVVKKYANRLTKVFKKAYPEYADWILKAYIQTFLWWTRILIEKSIFTIYEVEATLKYWYESRDTILKHLPQSLV